MLFKASKAIRSNCILYLFFNKEISFCQIFQHNRGFKIREATYLLTPSLYNPSPSLYNRSTSLYNLSPSMYKNSVKM